MALWKKKNHRGGRYNYLGLTFSVWLSFRTALEEDAIKAKPCVIEIVLTLRKFASNSPKVFFKLFDA